MEISALATILADLLVRDSSQVLAAAAILVAGFLCARLTGRLIGRPLRRTTMEAHLARSREQAGAIRAEGGPTPRVSDHAGAERACGNSRCVPAGAKQKQGATLLPGRMCALRGRAATFRTSAVQPCLTGSP